MSVSGASGVSGAGNAGGGDASAAGGRARLRLAVEAAATGAWLGLAQVDLGFALLAGAGASALLFFALIAAWLAGGVAGALSAGPGRLSGARLLGLALAALAVARAALLRCPFDAAPAGVGLLAGAACGAYAGRFLRDRGAAWGDARALLLCENNGFVAGYVAAGALLFASSRALDATVAVLGVGLLLWRVATREAGAG